MGVTTTRYDYENTSASVYREGINHNHQFGLNFCIESFCTRVSDSEQMAPLPSPSHNSLNTVFRIICSQFSSLLYSSLP